MERVYRPFTVRITYSLRIFVLLYTSDAGNSVVALVRAVPEALASVALRNVTRFTTSFYFDFNADNLVTVNSQYTFSSL